MAKKKTDPTEPQAPVSLMDKMVENAHKNFGKKVLTATEMEKRRFGVEPYALAFQYLIHCNILPMQSIISISGPPKSYKTSAMLEFCRWFASPPINGMTRPIDTEGKLSPTKVRSMLSRALEDRCMVHPCPQVDGEDGWQAAGSWYLNDYKAMHEKIATARRTKGKEMKDYYGTFAPPMLMGIDSMTGTQSEEVNKKIDTAGFAGRTFDPRAQLNTQWLSSWAGRITGLPITVVCMLHLKEKVESSGSGPKQMYTPGGVASGFHTSLEIRTKQIQRNTDRADAEGTLLEWKVHFSSIGLDNRKIHIPYWESWDETTGDQICWFDWDTCLVNLLMELQTKKLYKVGEILTIREHPGGPLGKVFSCPEAGIANKDDALDQKMTAVKLGQLLQTDPAWRLKIQQAMRTQMYKPWYPNVEFDTDSVYEPEATPESELAAEKPSMLGDDD
jgi:hypothetical protein